MGYYLGALKKYATFSGRARRKEYWMFFLFNLIAGLVIGLIDRLLGTQYPVSFRTVVVNYGVISSIYSLLMILPGLAVTVRRLHDVDKSGGWIFISLVPAIGGIWLLILMLIEGTKGANRFGSVPKAG